MVGGVINIYVAAPHSFIMKRLKDMRKPEKEDISSSSAFLIPMR
jgi:hypothetical protein